MFSWGSKETLGRKGLTDIVWPLVIVMIGLFISTRWKGVFMFPLENSVNIVVFLQVIS